MTKETNVEYKYAIKVKEWGSDELVTDYTPGEGFGWWQGSVENARLFNTATEAEHAIAHRNSLHRPGAFVVVPVKLTTTRVIREDTVVEREYA